MMRMPQQKRRAQAWAGWLLCAALSLPALPALAQTSDVLPAEVAGAVIVDKLGAQVPLELKFKDENGNDVELQQYFNQGRPVILNLVYFNCPMLCTTVVNGMVAALKDLSYDPGKDFTILTVSISPLETSGLANIKRRNYLDLYGRPGAQTGWHFLTGTEGQINRLAETVGFGFKWDPVQKTYAHQAGIFVLTPGGKVSRTLYGVDFDPTTLKGSLLDAGQGAIGTPLDKVYFACLHFDAGTGKYTTSVLQLTRIVSAVVLLLFAGTLFGYFRYEARQRRLRAEQAENEDEPGDGGGPSGGGRGQVPGEPPLANLHKGLG
jgi:protein SCO1/2